MRYVRTVVTITLFVMLLPGCTVGSVYHSEYAHLPEYILRNDQITIDESTYILCDWNYPDFGPMNDEGAEAIARVDDRDPQRRSNGVLFTICQYSDRSFLFYVYEVDAYSGWGGYRVLRRSDIQMPELTYENVHSLESKNFHGVTRDAAVIRSFFSALNDETAVVYDDEVKNDEYYDTIICRNQDWPDFCYSITVRRYEEEYHSWSEFLGENGEWVVMPQALIEAIIGQSEPA